MDARRARTRWTARTALASPVMYGDQLGDAGRTLTALHLDGHSIGNLQAVRRHIRRRGDGHAAAEPRAGRHRREVADAVRAIVQGVLQSVDLYDRTDEARCQPEREQAVRDRGPPRQLAADPVDVDMDPLVVAGRLGEPV